jgi:Fe-S-cluster containining protein
VTRDAAEGAGSSAGGPGPDAGAAEELRAIYAEFDRATAAVGPRCAASGRCCDFPAWGHTLFTSALEAEVLVAENPLASFDPASALCPYWKERRCTARAARPLACRAFFCDASKEAAMAELHEAHLRRLKDLHDRRGLPWRYAPLLAHLAAVLPPPPAAAAP